VRLNKSSEEEERFWVMMAEQHRKRTLDSGWVAARSTEVHFTGTQLTTTHPPTGSTSPWMEALVPST